MQGIKLKFDEKSVVQIKQQFSELIKGLEKDAVVRLNLTAIKNDLTGLKSEFRQLTKSFSSPIDLKSNTAQVQDDLKKTVNNIDEAVKHYENLGKVISAKRNYDKDGNLKDFIIELERTEGLIERINYKGSTFQDMGNGKTKAIQFSTTRINENDSSYKAVEKLTSSIDSFKNKQIKALDELRYKFKNIITDENVFNDFINDLNKITPATENVEKEMDSLNNKFIELKRNLSETERIQKLGELKTTVSPDLFNKSNDEVKNYIQSLYGADAKIVGFKKSVDGTNNSIIQMTVNTRNAKNHIEQETIVLDKNTQSLYKNSESIKNNNTKNVGFVDRMKNALVAVTS